MTSRRNISQRLSVAYGGLFRLIARLLLSASLTTLAAVLFAMGQSLGISMLAMWLLGATLSSLTITLLVCVWQD